MMASWTTSCLLLLAAAGALGSSINADVPEPSEHVATLDRLSTIEATLDFVLRKNAEQEQIVKAVLQKNADLEKRVEVLENENRLLNEMVVVLSGTGDKHRGRLGALKGGMADKPRSEIVDRSHKIKGQSILDDDIADDYKAMMGDRQAKLQSRVVKRQLSTAPSGVFVGFTATISTHRIENLGQADTIIYDNILTNVGNVYLNNTGVFTAPVTGTYVFNVDTMIEGGDTELIELVKDGVPIVRSLAVGARESHYVTDSRTVLLQVPQGGKVWVRTTKGSGTIHGEHFSSFSGWLLATINN